MDRQGAFITESQIQYLPSLLTKLERGEIQIPVFQRPFVWKQSQVVELLESIYRGYPIGALFFWMAEQHVTDMGNNNFLLFPASSDDYVVPLIKSGGFPPIYVLDGVQRLSSLYGVFNWKAVNKPSTFNIVFDLREQKFLPYKGGAPRTHLSLSALFTPMRLFDAQRELALENDSNELIERAIDLHSRFQGYSVPVITIRGGEVTSVVEIFDRINTRGTQLTLSEVVSSLITRSDFDFDNVFENVDARLSERGFTVSRDLFVKVLAITFDRSPIPREVLYLRGLSNSDILRGCELASNALESVSDFLVNHFKIYSFECAPYEQQILILAKFFSLSNRLSTELTQQLVRWFWRTSFSETFRGKPLDYTMNIVQVANKIVVGDYGPLDTPLHIGSKDFLSRSFIRGRAFSLAVAALMAVKKPRSLMTGELIEPAVFMNEASLENFQALFPRNKLELINQTQIRSNRVIANTVVVAETERQAIRDVDPKRLIRGLLDRFGDDALQLLDSQFISDTASHHILQEDANAFLRDRANALFQFATLVSGTTSSGAS